MSALERFHCIFIITFAVMSLEVFIAHTPEVVLAGAGMMDEVTVSMVQAGLVVTRIHNVVMTVSGSQAGVVHPLHSSVHWKLQYKVKHITQPEHDVRTALYGRCYDVKTLKQYLYNVVLTSCTIWVYKKYLIWVNFCVH